MTKGFDRWSKIVKNSWRQRQNKNEGGRYDIHRLIL